MITHKNFEILSLLISFSSTGVTLYYYLSQALEEDNAECELLKQRPINLIGCVFDSCPAPRSLCNGNLSTNRKL